MCLSFFRDTAISIMAFKILLGWLVRAEVISANINFEVACSICLKGLKSFMQVIFGPENCSA